MNPLPFKRSFYAKIEFSKCAFLQNRILKVCHFFKQNRILKMCFLRKIEFSKFFFCKIEFSKFFLQNRIFKVCFFFLADGLMCLMYTAHKNGMKNAP